MKTTAPHIWHQPVCGQGDRVLANRHCGRVCAAYVANVETHYSADDRKAYHIYCLHFDGFKRREWHGEENIIRIIDLAVLQ